MHKALGLLPSTKKKKKREREKSLWRKIEVIFFGGAGDGTGVSIQGIMLGSHVFSTCATIPALFFFFFFLYFLLLLHWEHMVIFMKGLFFIVVIGGGYIVPYTMTLTMCQIYHTWMHPSTALLHPPSQFLEQFNRYHFLYICGYIMCTTCILLLLSLPRPPPSSANPTNPEQNLSCPPVLWFCRRKNIKGKKRNMTFLGFYIFAWASMDHDLAIYTSHIAGIIDMHHHEQL
jgi:hypothetical protein